MGIRFFYTSRTCQFFVALFLPYRVNLYRNTFTSRVFPISTDRVKKKTPTETKYAHPTAHRGRNEIDKNVTQRTHLKPFRPWSIARHRRDCLLRKVGLFRLLLLLVCLWVAREISAVENLILKFKKEEHEY